MRYSDGVSLVSSLDTVCMSRCGCRLQYIFKNGLCCTLWWVGVVILACAASCNVDDDEQAYDLMPHWHDMRLAAGFTALTDPEACPRGLAKVWHCGLCENHRVLRNVLAQITWVDVAWLLSLVIPSCAFHSLYCI
jgi:hypothetical protein